MGRCQNMRRLAAPVATGLRLARNRQARWGLLVLFCWWLPRAAEAQDKALGPPAPVGFAQPADIGPLLDYRLPAWGWRTLNAGLQFRYDSNDLPEKSSHYLELASRWRTHFESEDRVRDLEIAFSGSSRGRPPLNLTDVAPNGEIAQLTMASLWDQYVVSHLAVRSGMRASYYYSELDRDSGATVYRSSSLSPTLGLAWGRLRNVGPLLRAQRLSERLVALGRPGLSAEQVQATARLFAQHSGFAIIYDRADKQFWGRVLDNLPLAEPLEPWEVMFLAEVLDEVYGDRLEGTQFDVVGHSWYSGGTYHPKPWYSGDLGWSFYRNISLNTQLHVRAQVERRWYDGGTETAASLGVGHLWNIADRALWTNSVRAVYHDAESGGKISEFVRRITVSSQWDYYLENTLVLSPGIQIVASETVDRDYVNWDIFLHLTWFFDRALY